MSEFEQDNNETQAALDAGRALAKPHALDKTVSAYSVVVPRGATAITVRTPPAHPEFTDAPLRAMSTYKPATVAAFVGLVERHIDENETTIWAHPTSGRFVAVFNDHGTLGPAWRDHRANLQLIVPPEWSQWLASDGKLLDQIAFAEFVEDHLAEIVEPDGATMLEIAQSFHATTKATFRSAQRLKDGRVQVQYDEEVTAHAGESGKLEIPAEFKVALRPFIGEAACKLTALLRYRQGNGKLQLGFKLQRPDEAVRIVLDGIVGQLEERFPGVVFVGEPGV